MAGFEGTAVREKKTFLYIRGMFVCARVGERKCALLVILTTCDGHLQFPSALYGSIYSELREADEALSLLILHAKTDGGWWYIINTENKMSRILIS